MFARAKNGRGAYTSIFDLVSRVNLRAVNKRCFGKSVAMAVHLILVKLSIIAQYFVLDPKDNPSQLEKARYAMEMRSRKVKTALSKHCLAIWEVWMCLCLKYCLPKRQSNLEQLKRKKKSLVYIFQDIHWMITEWNWKISVQ
ncbi:MAG: hypothetical protein R2847_03300 [Bacteroidia bacterium]